MENFNMKITQNIEGRPEQLPDGTWTHCTTGLRGVSTTVEVTLDGAKVTQFGRPSNIDSRFEFALSAQSADWYLNNENPDMAGHEICATVLKLTRILKREALFAERNAI